MANFDIFRPPRRMRQLRRGQSAAAGDADFSFARRRLGGSGPRGFRLDEPLDAMETPTLGLPRTMDGPRFDKGELTQGLEPDAFGRLLGDGSVRRLGDPMDALEPHKGQIGEVGVDQSVQDGPQASNMMNSPLGRIIALMSAANPLTLAALLQSGGLGGGQGGFSMGRPRFPGGRGGLLQWLQSLR